MKLANARVRLVKLERGGAQERPLEVESASVIEPHALSMRCPACGEQGSRVDEHLATNGLREVKLLCPWCGVRRELWFRITQMRPS